VRHRIRPLVEVLPMAEINTAIERLRSGDVRYRFVLQGPASGAPTTSVG
jgi:uncharacterized zinc-type alcohol dehydrogenase-like protein